MFAVLSAAANLTKCSEPKANTVTVGKKGYTVDWVEQDDMLRVGQARGAVVSEDSRLEDVCAAPIAQVILLYPVFLDFLGHATMTVDKATELIAKRIHIANISDYAPNEEDDQSASDDDEDDPLAEEDSDEEEGALKEAIDGDAVDEEEALSEEEDSDEEEEVEEEEVDQDEALRLEEAIEEDDDEEANADSDEPPEEGEPPEFLRPPPRKRRRRNKDAR